MKMLRRILAGWARTEDGTTAIEFALLSLPFVFLVLAIIEISMMYTAETLMEGATNYAARMIRTGQLQQSGSADMEHDFRTAMCNYATVLLRCDDIVIEVQPMDNFESFDDMQPEYDEDGNVISRGFDPGGSESKILVRTSYRYRMLEPVTGTLLLGPTASRIFMSTIVFETEPYQFDGT